MRGSPGVRVASVEAGVWLTLASIAYGLTYQFDEPLSVYRLGAAGWPRALIVLIVVVALCQLGSRLKWFRRPLAARQPEAAAPRAGGARLKRLATFVLPVLYVFLLPRVGYYAATPFFLTAYMLLLGERRLRHLVGTMLLIYALVLLAFTKLFFVPLPTGVWPGFYDFSNWFLSLIQ